MAVTRTFAASSDQFFQQIDRLTKSSSLRGSESLCKLLQYLAKQALDNPDAPLKEYQIATEVYGRNVDFDPQSDSTIRVQAGRLRMKLAEYYATEGVNDPIVVKIPKGSYHLVFEPRQFLPQPQTDSVSHETPAALPVKTSIPGSGRLAIVALATCLVIALALLAVLFWNRRAVNTAPVSMVAPHATGPLAEFWRPFASATGEPWVIYSNAKFVGRPETGMRYYVPKKDSADVIYDHYTGVGEVLAVHSLDEVFSTLGRHIRVKRSSLFTLDDANNTNLIFVGSPSENLPLLDIPSTKEFVFQRVASGPRKGDLAIVNRHPQPGEATQYLASPSNQPLMEDYGVVALVPGMSPGLFVMTLAGTTTFGTQGSVEFASRADDVSKLLQKIPGSANTMRPFEALVHIKIARGVPLETDLVSLRLR